MAAPSTGRVLVFLGPPGAGKGTQAARLGAELDLEKVSTGDMLRDHMSRGTELGKQVRPIYDAGGLVPDEVVISMIRERLEGMSVVRVIFDGFPRTVGQARELDRLLEALGSPVTAAPLLEVPEAALVERIVARARVEGRSDDTPETVRRRLEVYENSTRPLVDYYASHDLVRPVDGTGTPDEVYLRLRAAVA